MFFKHKCKSPRGTEAGGNLARRFKAGEGGNVAVIFALGATLIIGIVGAGVDYGRALHTRSKMQDSMDSAVLAAARSWQVESNAVEARVHGEAMFDASKPQGVPVDRTITVNTTQSTVSGSASAAVPAPFLFMTGRTSFDVSVEAEALLAVGGNAELNVELSMMLDVTGSMCSPCSKIDDLKLAAKDLINIIVWDNQGEYTSKVALVPFSYYVNVGASHFQKVTGQSGSNSNKTCVKERSSSSRYTDEAPGPGKYFDAYYSSSCKPGATVMPLTNDKNALNSHIDALNTGGSTAGHLGTQWSWYALSPNFNNVWSGGSQAAPYPPGHDSGSQATREAAYESAKLKKIAVLMTDGVYNKKYTGSNSGTQAKAHCDAMKAKGIEVYAVGFELTNSSARALMQYCAADPDHFYDASSGEELRMSFRDIAMKIASLRLSK